MAFPERTYKTPGEHRAFVDGTHDTIQLLLNILADHWRRGDDNIELDMLRGWLNARTVDTASHVGAAQKLEAEERTVVAQTDLVEDEGKLLNAVILKVRELLNNNWPHDSAPVRAQLRRIINDATANATRIRDKEADQLIELSEVAAKVIADAHDHIAHDITTGRAPLAGPLLERLAALMPKVKP